MIDFSTIEGELATRIGALGLGFKTTEAGRIREVIPIASMPALDIAAQGHQTTQSASRDYTVPMICVIRRKGFDRTANATEFKELVEAVCANLEGYSGTSFDVVRDIASQLGEEQSGDGSLVRSVVITFKCLAH